MLLNLRTFAMIISLTLN